MKKEIFCTNDKCKFYFEDNCFCNDTTVHISRDGCESFKEGVHDGYKNSCSCGYMHEESNISKIVKCSFFEQCNNFICDKCKILIAGLNICKPCFDRMMEYLKNNKENNFLEDCDNNYDSFNSRIDLLDETEDKFFKD